MLLKAGGGPGTADGRRGRTTDGLEIHKLIMLIATHLWNGETSPYDGWDTAVLKEGEGF